MRAIPTAFLQESRLSAHAALAARLGVSVAVSDGVIRGALGPDAAAAALASALSGGTNNFRARALSLSLTIQRCSCQ